MVCWAGLYFIEAMCHKRSHQYRAADRSGRLVPSRRVAWQSGAHVGMHSDHTFGGGQEQRAAADIGDIVLGAGRVVDRIARPSCIAAFKPDHQVNLTGMDAATQRYTERRD